MLWRLKNTKEPRSHGRGMEDSYTGFYLRGDAHAVKYTKNLRIKLKEDQNADASGDQEDERKLQDINFFKSDVDVRLFQVYIDCMLSERDFNWFCWIVLAPGIVIFWVWVILQATAK